ARPARLLDRNAPPEGPILPNAAPRSAPSAPELRLVWTYPVCWEDFRTLGMGAGGGTDSPPLPLAALEHLLDPAQSLSCSLLILYQRKTDVAIAMLTEADAGTYCDLRFQQEPLGKFHRAERAILFRNLRPCEHR